MRYSVKRACKSESFFFRGVRCISFKGPLLSAIYFPFSVRAVSPLFFCLVLPFVPPLLPLTFFAGGLCRRATVLTIAFFPFNLPFLVRSYFYVDSPYPRRVIFLFEIPPFTRSLFLFFPEFLSFPPLVSDSWVFVAVHCAPRPLFPPFPCQGRLWPPIFLLLLRKFPPFNLNFPFLPRFHSSGLFSLFHFGPLLVPLFSL